MRERRVNLREVVLIAAMSRNRVIGANGIIPWQNDDSMKDFRREDFKHFKELTIGHPVVMGRRTYDSIPPKFRPLPGRQNIVITRDVNYAPDGVIVSHSIGEALDLARNYDSPIFIAGGQQIYEQTISRADRLEITHIEREYEGDAFFPEINLDVWKGESIDKREGYSFIKYLPR